MVCCQSDNVHKSTFTMNRKIAGRRLLYQKLSILLYYLCFIRYLVMCVSDIIRVNQFSAGRFEIC